MKFLYDFSCKLKWWQSILFYIIYSVCFLLLGFMIGYYDILNENLGKILFSVIIFTIGFLILKKKNIENKQNQFLVLFSSLISMYVGVLFGLIITSYLTTKSKK